MNNEGKYEKNPVVHVHFEEVTDIRWDPSKNLFFSFSHDETTKCFRLWEKNKTRHDVNRRQISRYLDHAFSCVEYSKNNKGEQIMLKNMLASEEKVLRMFNTPFNIIKFLKQLSEN